MLSAHSVCPVSTDYWELLLEPVCVQEEDSSWRAAKWSLKMTLRSHLDSIRAMQFHPVEPVLFTASEDGTAKMWNLDHNRGKEDKHGRELNLCDFSFLFSPQSFHISSSLLCCWSSPMYMLR